MWHMALSGVLTFIVMSGLYWLARRARPMHRDDVSGSIRPNPIAIGLGLIVGLGVSLSAFWASAFANAGFPALAVSAGFAVLSALLVPSFLSVSILRWDAHGIEGPGKAIWPPWSRNRIAWVEIVGGGSVFGGYNYVEAEDGRRVYWTDLYSGTDAFIQALVEHCPPVELPVEID